MNDGILRFYNWLVKTKQLRHETADAYARTIERIGESLIAQKEWFANTSTSTGHRRRSLSAVNLFREFGSLEPLEVTLPRHAEGDKKNKVYPTYVELQDRLSNVTARRRGMYRFMLMTGVRVQELCNILRTDVTKSLVFVEGKGGKSRSIPIPHQLGFVEPPQTDDWLFTNSRGGKLRPGTVREWLQKDMPGVSPHDFRHAYATRLLEGGTPLPVVSKLLGHSDIRTTMKYCDTQSKDCLGWVEGAML